MSKPYNWRDEEVDTYTKNHIDGMRSDEEPISTPSDFAEELELDQYPDSVEYKCPICGRAKPCRHHGH